MVEVNCRRIVAISPVFLGLYVGNIILLMLRRNPEYFMASVMLTGALAVYEKRLEAPVKDVAEYVTISIGAAMVEPEGGCIQYENLLGEADKALYEAKRAGRNRVAHAR